MKINLDIDGKYDDTEVIIRAPHLNNDIERIVAMMRMIDMQIAVRKDHETFLLETDKILYVEAVDRKTFVYTSTETYESELKLYELEQERINSEYAADRKSQVGTGMRNERIRTYNFPQGRVTDHRIGLSLYKIDAIMDGDLDELIDALVTADQADRLRRNEAQP